MPMYRVLSTTEVQSCKLYVRMQNTNGKRRNVLFLAHVNVIMGNAEMQYF